MGGPEQSVSFHRCGSCLSQPIAPRPSTLEIPFPRHHGKKATFGFAWNRRPPADCSSSSFSKSDASLPAKNVSSQKGEDGSHESLTNVGTRGTLRGGSRPSWAAGASGAAALLTCCALHPFDLIKTRMQVSAVTQGAIPHYSSTRSAIIKIFQQEGVKGLWKGVGVTATASSVSWACFRYVFDSLSLSIPGWRKSLFGDSKNLNEGAEREWFDDVAGGLLAGVFVTGLTHPLWLTKARIEMQAKETEGGVKECYRGIGPALALTPHVAIQVAMYEMLKRNHIAQNTSTTLPTGLPAVWGAVSKFVALSATYPLQVLRSRQQVHNTPYGDLNFLQLGVRMIRKEGILSLFSGYWVHTQRACLQSGIMFLIYEGILSKAASFLSGCRITLS